MKRTIIRQTPQARRDLLELARYIARDDMDAALRLLDAAEADMTQLSQMPELGPMRKFSHPLLVDVRSWIIRGFPNHLIFYRPISEDGQTSGGGIEVLRVLHGSRDIVALFEP